MDHVKKPLPEKKSCISDSLVSWNRLSHNFSREKPFVLFGKRFTKTQNNGRAWSLTGHGIFCPEAHHSLKLKLRPQKAPMPEGTFALLPKSTTNQQKNQQI